MSEYVSPSHLTSYDQQQRRGDPAFPAHLMKKLYAVMRCFDYDGHKIQSEASRRVYFFAVMETFSSCIITQFGWFNL